MKKFKMTHRFLIEAPPTEFDASSPPTWLVSKTYNWWYEGYVLKLDVGESIDSDFQTIKRAE